tara:strand:+ start:476 stop:697 length:222 start_codon:yes stop_codon:yes gene_type:complete
MDLIPITQMIINKDKWLSKKIKYEDDIYYNDIMNDITKIIIQWINEKDDLEITSDLQQLKDDLIHLLLPFVKK